MTVLLWKRRHRSPGRSPKCREGRAARPLPLPAAQTLVPARAHSPVGVGLAHTVQERLRVPEKRPSCGDEVGATDVEPDTVPRRWAAELNPHSQRGSRWQ